MINRAIFTESVTRRSNGTRPHLCGSGPFSNLHRLATNTPSMIPTATRRPFLRNPFPPNLHPARRASFSLWSSGNAKLNKQRVIEASHRYNDLDNRDLLLLYLDKQDESWSRQSSRVRMPSWADYASWVIYGMALLYAGFYVSPQLIARDEKDAEGRSQNWSILKNNHRLVYEKLAEIEKRLDEKK